MAKNLGNVYILGDSYSTYEGHLPKWHVPYYLKDDGVLSGVDATWWMRFIKETGSHLVANASWSGTTICNYGYDGDDYSNISFIGRVRKDLRSGEYNGEKVDTVIIFGGTNDDWAGSPLGEIKFDNVTDKDLYSVFPAFCSIIKFLQETVKGVRIINVINCDLRKEITSGLQEICRLKNIDCVTLNNIDKYNGHPTEKGMKQISDQIQEIL